MVMKRWCDGVATSPQVEEPSPSSSKVIRLASSPRQIVVTRQHNGHGKSYAPPLEGRWHASQSEHLSKPMMSVTEGGKPIIESLLEKITDC